VIEELLPEGTACSAVFGDLSPELDGGLFPEEAAVIAESVPKRQAEFTTVRLCARHALRQLGVPVGPLVPNQRGAVTWPAGVSGSMTHCTGFRAAVVARTEVAVSLGLDAEPNLPLRPGVLETISLERELRQHAALRAHSREVAWDKLLFSAKESVFKAWYPLTGRELDFEEAELEIDPEAGTFTARLLVPGPVVAGRRLGLFPGRWLARRGFVVTAVALPGAG
jgi:4'-phosphopantetheinyl transferase EntD